MKRLKRANKWLLDQFSCKDPMSDFQSPSLRNTSQFDSKPTYRQILDAEQLLAIQRESLTEDSISPKSSSIIFEFSDPQSEKDCPSTVLGRNRLLEVTGETHIPPTQSPSPVIPIAAPLLPLYQPGQAVPQVWSRNHSSERLYRYRHIEGIIYPPGYLP